MSQIKITIHKDGSVEIENFGIVGAGCTDISNKLSAALGGETEQELKKEYYEIPVPDFVEVGEE